MDLGGAMIFKFKCMQDFGEEESRELGYGENYQDLTINLSDTIYELNYQEFLHFF